MRHRQREKDSERDNERKSNETKTMKKRERERFLLVEERKKERKNKRKKERKKGGSSLLSNFVERSVKKIPRLTTSISNFLFQSQQNPPNDQSCKTFVVIMYSMPLAMMMPNLR